jgi:HK97 family phage portal protein
MPFFRAIGDELTSRFNRKDTAPVNAYEGFTGDGRVILRDRRGTRKAEIPDVDTKSGAGGSDPLAIYKPSGSKSVDAAKAMANFTGWTYAAVNAIASEVSNIQFRLYQVKPNDDQEEADPDHELLTLLDGVNEHMTGPELKYVTMAHLELTGNFFWLLDGVNSDRDKPRAIYPLNPGRVKVKLNKSVFPYKISHYEFTLDGKVYTFQPYQILHGKYPDPNDPYVGIGVPQTIPVWIDSDNYAMEYNRKYFLNGAQIGLYIETETNVEGNLDRIKRGMRDGYAGVENAHKIPVLPKGVKLEHTGVTHKDMDFQNLAEATRDRILAGFRVSKTILGTAESDTNRATAETADYVFSKRTIKPKVELVLSYLNEFLVPRYGDDLYLTFIDPVPEDKAFRTQEMQATVGNMPLLTQNEARDQFLGVGPVAGGDQLMRPAAMVPAGQTAEPEGDELAPEAAPSGGKESAPTPEKLFRRNAKTVEGWAARPIRIRTGGKSAHSATAQFRHALTDAFKKQLDTKIQTDYTAKSVKDLTHAEYMEHWKRFADRSERAEAELHKVFLGINKNQKEEVLANLAKATGIVKALDELFDEKEWMGITVNLATPIIMSLARDEAAAALAMIGAQGQDILADQSIRNALEQGISKMARSYNETTLDQLKDKIGEKLTQTGGTNLNELTETVDDVYSFADERRAGLIAKTESFRAANYANKAAWQASGVVKTVKWFTADDGKVCEFCQAQDGKEIAVEENFYNAGDTIEGSNGGTMTASYGDIDTPPLHPDCRCFIRPEDIEI